MNTLKTAAWKLPWINILRKMSLAADFLAKLFRIISSKCSSNISVSWLPRLSCSSAIIEAANSSWLATMIGRSFTSLNVVFDIIRATNQFGPINFDYLKQLAGGFQPDNAWEADINLSFSVLKVWFRRNDVRIRLSYRSFGHYFEVRKCGKSLHDGEACMAKGNCFSVLLTMETDGYLLGKINAIKSRKERCAPGAGR